MSSFDAKARERAAKRMARVDAMPPPLRALVHEYGLTIVDQFVASGVKSPRAIKHLIDAVRSGSVEIGNRSESRVDGEAFEASLARRLEKRGYTVIKAAGGEARA